MARFGHALQPGRQVRCRSGHRFRIAPAFTDEIADDDLAGGNANARRQGAFIGNLDIIYRGHGVQARAHGTFCLILICLRPTEVGEHAIAEVFGNVPTIACYRTRYCILISPHDIAMVFGIELPRQCRRANQVAEHDRKLSTFGSRTELRLLRYLGAGRARRRMTLGIQLSDGL